MVGTQERFGQALVELGLVDPSNLAELIATQRKTGRRLGPLVVEAGLLLEERYLPALARHVGLDRVDPTKAPIHRRVLDLVPASIARRHHVIPVARRKEDGLDRIVVAIADPFDDEAAAAVTAALPDGATPGWLLAGDSEIDQALATYYDQSQPPPLKAAPQSPVEGHETEPGNVRMGGSAAVYFDEDGTEVAAPQDPTASTKPSAI